MPTPRQPTRISAAEWKARYAQIQFEEQERAVRTPPDEPKFLLAELEYVLINPPVFSVRSLRVPSDPEGALMALAAHVYSLAKP